MTEEQQNSGLKAIAARISDLLDGVNVPVGMKADDVTITLTRQDISALAAGLIEEDINPKMLVAVQRDLMERDVVFISLPKDGAPFYYVTHRKNAMLKAAVPVTREHRDLIITRSNTSLANIQLLSNMGFSRKDLATTTCKSIGHSSFGIFDKRKDHIVCIRCGSKHSKARTVIDANGAICPLRESDGKKFVEVSWRDVVHVPDNVKPQLIAALYKSSARLVNTDDSAGDSLVSVLNSDLDSFKPDSVEKPDNGKKKKTKSGESKASAPKSDKKPPTKKTSSQKKPTKSVDKKSVPPKGKATDKKSKQSKASSTKAESPKKKSKSNPADSKQTTKATPAKNQKDTTKERA